MLRGKQEKFFRLIRDGARYRVNGGYAFNVLRCYFKTVEYFFIDGHNFKRRSDDPKLAR